MCDLLVDFLIYRLSRNDQTRLLLGLTSKCIHQLHHTLVRPDLSQKDKYKIGCVKSKMSTRGSRIDFVLVRTDIMPVGYYIYRIPFAAVPTCFDDLFR